jgi:sugar transferase EpsL
MYRLFKRIIDLTAAAVGLVVLSPVIAAVALAVRIAIGSPVLFWQERPGYKCRSIYIVKFRTMSHARNDRGELLPDGHRLTRLGRFLRATSLDELPQLWNVLKGEMSLVGPRPLLMEYLQLYTPEQARRHDAKPGITGWAQINGRNAVSWAEKFKLDVWYVDHASFLLDIRILLLTLLKVFRPQGISQPGHVTVEPFRGKVSPATLAPFGDEMEDANLAG